MARILSLTCSLIIVYLCTTGIECKQCARTNILVTETKFCLFGCCNGLLDLTTGFDNKDICCAPSTGAIVGISVGGIVLLISFIACCYCCCCRQPGRPTVVVAPSAAPTMAVVGAQGGYPPQQGYPMQTQGYPMQQPGYPMQQPGYPMQQPGYPQTQQPDTQKQT
ncbi:hypothetical protein SNE40_013684 [Patella caerulea]|uniref:Uncharacterized protein n=1 Tax=Patella caerulea TaxID=87958 RepID=A0AAN8JCS4_PATCE